MATPRTSRNMTMEDQAERVASLETAQHNLHQDVTRLADSVGNLTRDFRSTMEGIQKQITEQNKTAWPVVLQGLAILLVVAGFVGSFYVRDLGKVEKQTEAQGIALLTHFEKQNQKQMETMERLHRIELEMAREKND